MLTQTERELIDNTIQHARRWIWVRFQKEGIHWYPAAGVEISMALLKVKKQCNNVNKQ
jgi:hypothetical protein